MSTTTDWKNLQSLTIAQLAHLAALDWEKPWYAAVPYLNAMHEMADINDRVFNDEGRHVVNYFLGNATRWKGDNAKAIKAELRRRMKR